MVILLWHDLESVVSLSFTPKYMEIFLGPPSLWALIKTPTDRRERSVAMGPALLSGEASPFQKILIQINTKLFSSSSSE